MSYHNEQLEIVRQMIARELRGWRQPLDRTTATLPSAQIPTAGTTTATRGAVSFLQGTPQPIAAAGAIGGSAGRVSYADHVHAHGNLAGGALHGTAVSGTAGFMGTPDKAKVDNLAVSAGGTVSVAAAYQIGGTTVVGPRVTGWTAASGTADRGTFDTTTVTLPELAERLKSLIDDLLSHGLIGP